MKIIGIDPAYAKPCAYAIWDCDHIEAFGLFDTEMIYKCLSDLNEDFGPFNSLVVENSWAGKNIAITQKLSESIGRIMGWAMENEINFVKLHPSKWRATIPRLAKLPRKYQDRLIQDVAKSIAGTNKPIQIDQACAIHIAAYMGRRL